MRSLRYTVHNLSSYFSVRLHKSFLGSASFYGFINKPEGILVKVRSERDIMMTSGAQMVTILATTQFHAAGMGL